MKIRLFVHICIFLTIGVSILQNAAGQDDIQQGFDNLHQNYGSLQQQRAPFEDNASPPAAAPAPPPVPTMQQQMEVQAAQQIGTALGNAIGNALRGNPAQQQAQQQALQAQQQRMLAAQQLNNSGLYLLNHTTDYTGAINEFQQALAYAPGDQNILNNIARAKQKIVNKAIAAKNSSALSQLLGGSDFDGSKNPQVSNPNSSVLNSVNLDSDPNVVDLRGTTKSYVDPALIKGDSPSQPADVQQTVKDLNNLLDNSADQAKKQLDQALGLNQNAPVQQPSGQEGTETTPAENTDGGETAGIKDLPGIALNDNTGNGGSKPYGISGLPGIYVNGPADGPGVTQPSPSPGSPPTPPPTPSVTATGSSPAPEPEPTPSGVVAESQPVAQPTEPATPSRTINLGNAGNPDFDGNMGGNSPITASGGSIPIPASAGMDTVASLQTAGQPGIVTPGENLKDAVTGFQLPLPFKVAKPQLDQVAQPTTRTDEESNDCKEAFAEYAESGLTVRLQEAIIHSLRKGDIIAVRKMALGASAHYGKGLGSEPFQPKPLDGTELVKLDNGMRIMADGDIVLSDLDTAFIIHNGSPVDNETAISYGEGINLLYGTNVCAHGDLYNGITVIENKKAEGVKKTDNVFVYKYCDGFVESGSFEDMVENYIPENDFRFPKFREYLLKQK
jgi:tetratricopeptide (TPR) repeat protein